MSEAIEHKVTLVNHGRGRVQVQVVPYGPGEPRSLGVLRPGRALDVSLGDDRCVLLQLYEPQDAGEEGEG